MHNVLDRINAIFITNPTNIRYLTGFVGAAPEEREVFALCTKNQTYLFTNALYRQEAKQTKATFVEISRENPISKELARICRERKLKKLGFEDTNLMVAEFNKLTDVLTGVRLVPTRDRVEQLRMIKRKDEIEYIRQAAKLTDQCFNFLLKKIKVGMTERNIAWEIETFFQKRDAESAFSPIVAFNKNSSQPHYSTMNNEPLSMNSLILLDFGAKVNGYSADMTRIIFIGQPDARWVSAYRAVLAANEKAVALLQSGERDGATLDAAAKEVIAEANLPPYPHSLGHAVGLDIHENPRLTVKKKVILKPNMVVTIEPAVYIEGSYGIRIEDLVLLKKNSIEILSKSPKEIITV